MKHFKTYKKDEPDSYEFNGFHYRVDRLDGGSVRMIPLPRQAADASKLPTLRAARRQFEEDNSD